MTGLRKLSDRLALVAAEHEPGTAQGRAHLARDIRRVLEDECVSRKKPAKRASASPKKNPRSEAGPGQRAKPGDADVLERWILAYGRRTRVLFLDARALIPELSRAEADAVIFRLFDARAISLFPLDSPRERTLAVDRAAFTLSGVPQHIFYIE